MDFSTFLRGQVATLVEQFFARDINAVIAVPDLPTLMQRQTLDGGRVVALPGFAAADAAIWRDSKDRVELWVRTEDKAAAGTDLYVRAWRQFVQFVAQTQALAQLNGRALQTDHLYPETAAYRSGLSYVRVMAVDARSNVLLGSTVEKFAANAKPGTFGRRRYATYFTLAKAAGFQGSLARCNSGDDVARAIHAFLRAQNYPVPNDPLEQTLTARKLLWYRGDN